MPETALVACSVFRETLARLRAGAPPRTPPESLRFSGPHPSPSALLGRMRVDFVDSMGHIHVERLRRGIDDRVAAHRAAWRRVLLLFGECHAAIDREAGAPDLRRVAGLNCYEILLGGAAYRELRRGGAFLLLPEWAARWRGIFRGHLGVDDAVGRAMLTDTHREIVYLDDGVTPAPTGEIAAFSAYAALPWRRMPLPPEPLRAALEAALAGWAAEEAP